VSLSVQKAGHLAELMCRIRHASTFTDCFVIFLPPSTNDHLVYAMAGVCGGGMHHLYFAGGSEHQLCLCAHQECVVEQVWILKEDTQRRDRFVAGVSNVTENLQEKSIKTCERSFFKDTS